MELDKNTLVILAKRWVVLWVGCRRADRNRAREQKMLSETGTPANVCKCWVNSRYCGKSNRVGQFVNEINGGFGPSGMSSELIKGVMASPALSLGRSLDSAAITAV